MYDVLPRSSESVLGIRIRAPFTDDKVRCFGTEEPGAAWAWLNQDAPAHNRLPRL